MKKHTIQFLSVVLWILLAAPATVVAQTDVTVYTPKNTAVPAKSYGELTSSQITDLNNQAAAQFPATERLANASSTYNCHAYAWYLSESPTSPKYWINTPGDDQYWIDGSYIQICNGSEASKISYANGDHSAIRSSVAGKYDSKWGNWPLLRHTPTNTPYNSSVLNYYVSTKINAATTNVCGPTAFSVASFTGGTYTWTKSDNIALNTTSGSSVTATANGPGATGWVQVTIGSSCSATSFTTRLNVTIGPNIGGTYSYGTYTYPIQYSSTGISVSNSAPSIYIYLNNPNYASSAYSWTTVSSSGSSSFSPSGNYASLSLSGGASRTVKCTVSTPCGPNSVTFSCYNYSSGGGWRVTTFPNPTSNQLTVEAVQEEKLAYTVVENAGGIENGAITNVPIVLRDESNSLASPKSDPPYFQVKLQNKLQQVVRSGSARNGKIVLDVAGLAEGIYYLEIAQGSEVTTKQISIRR